VRRFTGDNACEVSKQITIEKSIEDGVVTASVKFINGKVENKFWKEPIEVQAKN
jgi:hypothetical protein